MDKMGAQEDLVAYCVSDLVQQIALLLVFTV